MTVGTTIIVTGGAGFIGATLVRRLLAERGCRVVVVDRLTYAGHRESLAGLARDRRFAFQVADVADAPAMAALIASVRPEAIIHLAAESHVDRSIVRPAPFVQTNIVGTATLLEATTAWWQRQRPARRAGFRFLQVSTDEVFGSSAGMSRHRETTPYAPSSPYAASKAAADHLALAWHRSYGLPVLCTQGSNTYGPYQQPEKLIPLAIERALRGAPIPLYGDGRQQRDWLHVDDHVEALLAVLRKGQAGSRWCVGSGRSRPNAVVLATLCGLLDQVRPAGRPHARLIRRIADRPGHDHCYAIDPRLLRRETGWRPRVDFRTGLRDTLRWYLDHPDWLAAANGPEHRRWLKAHYGEIPTRVSRGSR